MIVTLHLNLAPSYLKPNCRTLGIGRTPIREALRLAREGLVLILPRKGILVSEINPGKQLLLLEVRRELERLLARSGAQRATDEERERFTEIADGMERSERENDDLGFMRLDDALNKLIATAAHNEYANRTIGLPRLSRRFGMCIIESRICRLPLASAKLAAIAGNVRRHQQLG